MKKFFISLCFVLLFCFSAIAQDYKTHRVKVGETIESIAKTYMVTPFDIYALNPDAKTSLEPNIVLIIPKSRILDTPIESQTTKLLGYKTHKVKRRETLYSISKKYNVTVADLKKHNNRLYSENLQRGDKINIPNYSNVRTSTNLGNTIKTYQVLPKEGKWRVAYKFGITVAELEKLNPKMSDTLKLGESVNVPNIANNEEKVIDEEYGYYTVIPREGFLALERKLGLTQVEIENLNPELKSSGLKAGMIIKVPKDVNNNSGNDDIQRSVLLDKLNNFSTKKIAVMLPFRLNRVDMDSIQEVKDMLRQDGILTNISLDFHTGVLMALDSVKQLGISTKLDVYDTKGRINEVSSIIRNNDFSNYDAIIGPFMANGFDRAAAMLRSDNVPMVSPVSKPSNLYGNVFQTIPPSNLMLKKMVNIVKQDEVPGRIIIISDAKNRNVSDALKREFSLAKQIFSRSNEETQKDAYYILMEDIEEELREGKNIVFLETSNEGFVSNVAGMLTAFNGLDEELEIEREIILMTTNKTKAFDGENVSNYSLSNLKFHYPSPNKPYNYELPNSFVTQYKNLWNTSPNKYAIRGFDLTMDVLLRLATQDNLYEASTNDIETEYVENKFRYSKKMFGGYYNEAIYIVKYQDLKIIEVRQE